MKTILSLLSNLREKPPVQRPDTPVSTVERETNCGNMACHRTTLDTSTWRKVTSGPAVCYLCSEDCYREILRRPRHYTAWSPQQVVTSPDGPPALTLPPPVLSQNPESPSESPS